MLLLTSLLLILDKACLCLCRNRSSSAICLEEERDALLRFGRSFSNTSHILSSWDGEDCCRWTGVKCDRANGHVVVLQITGDIESSSSQTFSTASELNSSLLNLRYLSSLELSGIYFQHANVLRFIGSMKQLRYLNLSYSLDSTTVSREWGNLTELEVLDLHTSYDESVGEDIQWVSHLQALKYLDMSGLNIAGFGDPMQVISILPSLSHLSLSECGLDKLHPSSDGLGNYTSLHLQYLDLSRNFFGGPIPSTIFRNMTFLRYLDLSRIFFEGPIPSTIFRNMTSLRHLDLSWNTFSSPIPSTIFNGMTCLRYLSLSRSFNQSSIPITIFQNMTSLRHLDLSWNTFSSPIPSTIFNGMTCLRHLDLSENHFEGPIPSTIFRNMTSLRHLDLSRNMFGGSIPSTIFRNMTSLLYLDLSWNLYNSSIPRWFDNLRRIVYLDLQGNHLQSIEGGLFSFLRNKPYLESLCLGNNELREEIFSVEGNPLGLIGKNLKKLDLSYNQLTGNIPEALGRLPVLSVLELSNNLLNGTVPHSLGQLQDLLYLDLSANTLRGTLSEIHFSKLSKLTYLDISNNYLAFEVHSDWIPPFNLFSIRMMSCALNEFPQWIRTQVNARIYLSNASITGALPDWLGLVSFDFLDLSYNQISGSLPNFSSSLSWIDLSHNQISGSLPNFSSSLSWLDLSHNQISGSLPNFSSSLSSLDLSHNQISGSLPKFSSNLYSLDLSHNSISGPIPQDIGLGMPSLDYLFLNDNLLSGPIPTSLCEMGLSELHLGRNELAGKIPACRKRKLLLNILDLSSNKLSGVIPSSLGNLIGLESLHLNNNSLEGEIPVSMSYCRNLFILDLGENKISGSVPHWFGPSFQLLQILRLRQNMFNGSIPSQLCSLSALQILDLAVNNLTGMIPNCLGHMKGMKLSKSIDEGNSLSPASEPPPAKIAPTDWNGEHVEQVVKGIDLDYTALDLQLMVNLDLSSNKLIGPIPGELTLLSGLRGLNLSRNFLSGGIPTMIGYMESLESLDLSNNHLSGTIPQSFSAFPSLNNLNLSHNNFTGPIPKGNQIQTLNDLSIYADNPLLCGDPLPKKCPGAEAPQAPEEGTDEESKFEKVMFYVVVMLGFATGFWGVIGVLVRKKNWRRAYFNYVDRKTDMVYVIVAVKAAKLRRRFRRA